MKKIVATSGHRDFVNQNSVNKFVDYLKKNDMIVVLGGAIGWDTAVAKKCFEEGVEYMIIYAFGYQKKAMPKEVHEGAKYTEIKESFYDPSKIYMFMQRNKEMVRMAEEVHVYLHPNVTTGGTWGTAGHAIYLKKYLRNWFE